MQNIYSLNIMTPQQELLQKNYQLVENVIRGLGVSPDDARQKEGLWSLSKGSAPVKIAVYWLENNNQGYVEVFSPIMEVPSDKAKAGELALKLLEMNTGLYGTQFYIHQGHIFLGNMRELTGLDKSEFEAILLRVGTYSEQHGKQIRQAFGT